MSSEKDRDTRTFSYIKTVPMAVCVTVCALPEKAFQIKYGSETCYNCD